MDRSSDVVGARERAMATDRLTASAVMRDPAVITRWAPLLDAFTALFSPTVHGIDNVPATGAALVVGNHSLFWPAEGWATARAIFDRRGLDTPMVGLAYDLLFLVPWLGDLLRRGGMVPARPGVAEAALKRGDLVMVYPGGDLDACRSWSQRDRVELGGHKGFVRLALRTGVPVVPMVTHGGQHGIVIVARGDRMARALHLGAVRVHVFPLLAGPPFGLNSILTPPLPLPTAISVEFLPSLDWSRHGAAAADDAAVVDACYEQTHQVMQEALDRLAGRQPHPVRAGLSGLVGLVGRISPV